MSVRCHLYCPAEQNVHLPREGVRALGGFRSAPPHAVPQRREDEDVHAAQRGHQVLAWTVYPHHESFTLFIPFVSLLCFSGLWLVKATYWAYYDAVKLILYICKFPFAFVRTDVEATVATTRQNPAGVQLMPSAFAPVGVTVQSLDLFAHRHPVFYSEAHPRPACQVPKQARLRTNSEVSLWAGAPCTHFIVIPDSHNLHFRPFILSSQAWTPFNVRFRSTNNRPVSTGPCTPVMTLCVTQLCKSLVCPHRTSGPN